MTESIDDFIKDLSPIIDLPVNMDEANEIIEIYSGKFQLKNEELELLIDGKIAYHWFAQKGAIFIGNLISASESPFKSDRALDYYELIIDGLSVGEAFIVNRKRSSSSEHTTIKGVFTKFVVIGDGSINVDSVTFAIPNLKEFNGLPVYKKSEDSVSTSNSRIVLDNDEFQVTIDKTIDYRTRKESLNSKGGYLLLYSGRINKKKGSISLKKSRSFFYCFDTFLSFLNGRRISTAFHNGVFKENIVWSDYSNYSIDIYKNSNSWTLMHSTYGFNELFKNFSNLWKDENDRSFLTSAIHWYIEANNNSGYTEGSIVMAQTALELIYNWLLIEKNGLLIGKDSENISAANKIRLLLSHLKIKNDVPETLDHLKEYLASNKEYIDGPETIVQIRNAIVHSQIEKRKKYSAIPFFAKHEALKLCLWYIEMSLLFILEYDGKYSNRCSNELYPTNREINVPWMNYE